MYWPAHANNEQSNAVHADRLRHQPLPDILPVAAKYPFHRGMLHLQDVPGFEWIYIHPGNNDDHTSGCILVGYNAARTKGNENAISRSIDAYSDLYKMIVAAMEAGEEITIDIRELSL